MLNEKKIKMMIHSMIMKNRLPVMFAAFIISSMACVSSNEDEEDKIYHCMNDTSFKVQEFYCRGSIESCMNDASDSVDANSNYYRSKGFIFQDGYFLRCSKNDSLWVEF